MTGEELHTTTVEGTPAREPVKISILTPVYCAEPYIEECARSLFSQDYLNIEYIFVDDASPDRSMELLRGVMGEYPDRDVKIVENPCNLGIAGSRNAALDAATGDYVLFVDSDDSLAAGAIAMLADRALNTGADIVSFDYVERRRRFSHTRCEPFAYVSKREYIRALLWRRAHIALWSKLIRRTLFNGLRFVPGMDYGEDFFLLPQLVYRADMVEKLDTALYNYRINPRSISNNLSPAKASQVVHAAELLERFFTPLPDYASMIAGMMMHNKIALLQSGDRATWRYARNLYGDVDRRMMSLRFGERLVLWLARRDAYRMMRPYRWAAGVRKRLARLGVKM